jgi:hypothetical protein
MRRASTLRRNPTDRRTVRSRVAARRRVTRMLTARVARMGACTARRQGRALAAGKITTAQQRLPAAARARARLAQRPQRARGLRLRPCAVRAARAWHAVRMPPCCAPTGARYARAAAKRAWRATCRLTARARTRQCARGTAAADAKRMRSARARARSARSRRAGAWRANRTRKTRRRRTAATAEPAIRPC